jgi:hypothetical protein
VNSRLHLLRSRLHLLSPELTPASPSSRRPCHHSEHQQPLRLSPICICAKVLLPDDQREILIPMDFVFAPSRQITCTILVIKLPSPMLC